MNGSERRVTPTATAMPESQVAQRSRWQAVLLEAGGLSAALSEESMRRLKYCLHWLQVCSLSFFSPFFKDLIPFLFLFE